MSVQENKLQVNQQAQPIEVNSSEDRLPSIGSREAGNLQQPVLLAQDSLSSEFGPIELLIGAIALALSVGKWTIDQIGNGVNELGKMIDYYLKQHPPQEELQKLSNAIGALLSHSGDLNPEMQKQLENIQEQVDAAENQCKPDGNRRGATRGANSRDQKQINDIAKEFKMTGEERWEFGDYIEKLKDNDGKPGDCNFSYKQLRKLARDFLENLRQSNYSELNQDNVQVRLSGDMQDATVDAVAKLPRSETPGLRDTLAQLETLIGTMEQEQRAATQPAQSNEQTTQQANLPKQQGDQHTL
jgi:hypothetical protein